MFSISSSGGVCEYQADRRSSEQWVKMVGRVEVKASPIFLMVEFSWQRRMLVEPSTVYV
jgi:hypothetical protein